MEKATAIIAFIQYIAAVTAIVLILPCVIGLMEEDFPIKPKHVVLCIVTIVVLQIIKIILV